MQNLNKYFKNKSVLVTGHTGFKGSWLSIWLTYLGAKVIGISNEVLTKPSNFEIVKLNKKINHNIVDIRNHKKFHNIIKKHKPDFIFHLAAQSLVLSGYKKILNTYKTNFLGTINIIEASKISKSTKALLITTTDKVYKNKGKNMFFNEKSELGGKDPYSASKAACEIAIQSYIKSNLTNHVNLASMRAGNVIGGGDYASNRLMTDLIYHFQRKNKKHKLIIRNPNAIRPWQYVLDVVNGYILLAEKLYFNKKFVGSFNFGPNKSLIKIKVKKNQD